MTSDVQSSLKRRSRATGQLSKERLHGRQEFRISGSNDKLDNDRVCHWRWLNAKACEDWELSPISPARPVIVAAAVRPLSRWTVGARCIRWIATAVAGRLWW